MNLNESSVRALLVPGAKDKAFAVQTTADMLKSHVDAKGMIDVSRGIESYLGVTATRLNTALAILKEHGYHVHQIKDLQLGTGKYTTTNVLASPGIGLKHVQQNRGDIKLINEYSIDHGRSFFKTQPPIQVNSKRIGVNYAEDHGDRADGVIYIRPGVKDLTIGSNNYGQVRIAVDGTHYLKGMAVYKDDLPHGKDIVFNTKRSKAEGWKTDKNKQSDDPELPFGAIIRQVPGPNGKVISAVNMVGSPTKEGSGEEGSWDKWSRNLSSQMLSKQSPELAKQQLRVTSERRLKEYNEIKSLTNPTVRKELLFKFADSTDAAAVHLKAANLPRQATRVLLPISSIKPNEIYAPGMRDGERVALIRYPHGGTFEIPELTVNNRNREAKRILGPNAMDAVGIHHTVAHHLSGADFDGDTVLVIPNNKGSVKKQPPLEGLKDFDPHSYKLPKDSPIPRMGAVRKGQEMGKISNLITDMTLHGASNDELSRAIRHSMVVIDAEKHELNFVQSEKDNGIASLKEKYQGGKRAGAATLISRARAEIRVPERKDRPAALGGRIDPITGRRVYVPTNRQKPTFKMVTDPSTGKKKRVNTGAFEPVRVKSERLAETHDARTLISKHGTPMEAIYAEHSNRLKSLADQARLDAIGIKGVSQSKSAKAVYANEVASLNAKLNIAKRNAPLERQAQRLASVQVSQRRQANPHMDKEDVKKIKQHALNEARVRTGAKKTKIVITQDEWNAIQARAISTNKLEEILTNSDLDTVKHLALPKHAPKMTPAKMARAQAMLANGFTQADVADQLGVGLTTLKVALNG